MVALNGCFDCVQFPFDVHANMSVEAFHYGASNSIGAANSLLQYAVRGMKLEARWHDFIHFVSTIPTHPLHSPPFLSSQTLQPTPSFTLLLPFFSIYHHAPLITRHAPTHSYPYPLSPFPPPLHDHAWPHKPLQMSPPFISIPHVPLCPSPCP